MGALWIVGYLATPVLFAKLDRTTAGQLAGEMFSLVHLIGLVCIPLLIAATLWRRSERPAPRLLVLGSMLALVLIHQVGLQPEMAALKTEGLVEGGEAAVRFGRLHAVSSALYVVNSLLGLLLIAGPKVVREE